MISRLRASAKGLHGADDRGVPWQKTTGVPNRPSRTPPSDRAASTDGPASSSRRPPLPSPGDHAAVLPWRRPRDPAPALGFDGPAVDTRTDPVRCSTGRTAAHSSPTHQAAADAQPDEEVAGLAGDVLVAVGRACTGRFPTCVTAARWSTRPPRRPLSGWRPPDSGRSARHRRNGARTSPRWSGRRRPAARRRCPDRGAAARSWWPAAPVSRRGAPPTPRQGRGGGGGADAPPPH